MAGENEVQPKQDFFGQDLKTEEAPADDTQGDGGADDKSGDDKGGDDKGKDGKGGKGADDIENNPVVKELRTKIAQIEGDKSSMGGNLSEQRKVIEGLKKDIAAIKNGEGKVEPLYKDIKFVKDLPRDEQDAMTDHEKRLHDEMAQMKTDANTRAASEAKEKSEAETKKETETEAAEKTTAFNTKVQGAAKELAGGDLKMANQIIEAFNMFKDNEALNDEQFKARLEMAAKMVPDFKPAKEQKQVKGGGAADQKDKDDVFGNAAIVEGAAKHGKGGYTL